jgi:hypothetical protein
MENITVGELLSCDHSAFKLGKERLLRAYGILNPSSSKLPGSRETPASWPARRWHDTVHPQVFDHLPVMVKSMNHGLDRQREPSCLGTFQR